MLYIQKNPPPGTFIQYQKSNGACFDGMDTDVKNALRTMAFCAVMKRDKQDKTASKGYLEKKLQTYQERQHGRYSPYCGILIWYLQRRIRQCG